jgi:glycine/D-amino acid oxidase-like deaminating enzyme
MTSPTTTSAEVVVIGGGLEGCSAAWALTRRGVHDILIFERDTVGSGGTGKSSGVVRSHYGVSSLAAMAARSLEVLENAPDVLASEAFIDVTVEKVGTRLPGLADPSIASTYAGCYDVTPDFNPVISETPVDGLVVAAGFSGHGFMQSPAAGRALAQEILGLDPYFDLSPYRLERFAGGAAFPETLVL